MGLLAGGTYGQLTPISPDSLKGLQRNYIFFNLLKIFVKTFNLILSEFVIMLGLQIQERGLDKLFTFVLLVQKYITD